MSSQMFVVNKVLAVNKIGGVEGIDELIEKSRKLSKTEKLSKSRNLKGKKLSKFQKLARSEKKLLKSGNLPNFNIKKTEPSFLTLKARAAFNHLQLAFIKTLILQHFNSECHIWIKTNALGYVISRVLSQLTSNINPNLVTTKANLDQQYSIAFFSQKMIFAETWYKIHNSKLLTIVEVVKT